MSNKETSASLFDVDEVQRLRAENDHLRAAAMRYGYIRTHYEWQRSAPDEGEGEACAFASVRFPWRTDLSCAAMLDYAIDKAMRLPDAAARTPNE